MTVEDCQSQCDEGSRRIGWGGWRGLQHVVNPKQETGEPLFIQLCVCVCVESGGGSELDEAPHTHFIWKQIVLECFKLTTAFFFFLPLLLLLCLSTGSDSWTAAERRQFNKGIAAYKKDFFTVQKQVCVLSNTRRGKSRLQ